MMTTTMTMMMLIQVLLMMLPMPIKRWRQSAFLSKALKSKVILFHGAAAHIRQDLAWHCGGFRVRGGGGEKEEVPFGRLFGIV